jgi:hypothetical protein
MALTKNREMYLKSVRPKQNRLWSPKEKVAIFTMRQKGVSCEDIAKKFDITLNQVHNVTRYTKNEKLNKCRLCGEKLTPEDKGAHGKRKICHKCFKKVQWTKRKLRRSRLALGLCEYCGEHKSIPGHTGCKMCISATHRRRYAENLCGACGKKPIRQVWVSNAETNLIKPPALCKACAKEMREKRKTDRLEQSQHLFYNKVGHHASH